ncbi:MAG: hypothetical protein JWM87_725 [Candidatus Eremiobacteraeota bacterium]|nr:hypothetical protein [Candidatus Eremiobacteraeota bacterium]
MKRATLLASIGATALATAMPLPNLGVTSAESLAATEAFVPIIPWIDTGAGLVAFAEATAAQQQKAIAYALDFLRTAATVGYVGQIACIRICDTPGRPSAEELRRAGLWPVMNRAPKLLTTQ